MSSKTWRDEFYPIPANLCPESSAVKHSLRKWQGLVEENLTRHGLELHGRVIKGKNQVHVMDIDHRSCALCVWYLDKRTDDHRDECVQCPLFKQLGAPCDGTNSPYALFITMHDPQPMIDALTQLHESIGGDGDKKPVMKNQCSECKTVINRKKSYTCRNCQGVFCGKHIYFYVDGNNGAITKNSPPLCETCYKEKHS